MLRIAFALLLAGFLGLAQAQEISRAELPREAHDTLRLIAQGGPFPHKRDGIVFQNREKLLPRAPHGFYREYTVSTPGVRHRGARRIVCGSARVEAPTCYYTADHYQSFRKIVP
ncbi:MAG: ribonuclease domain-containing protein [Rhodocyclaceae bacterium]|nr:ribonuclease domain-containing protein [Rhodocyclaceae bacterium]MDP1957920.1 ribonuclease domain-containing protein [Rhodocyclaceae bacterium]